MESCEFSRKKKSMQWTKSAQKHLKSLKTNKISRDNGPPTPEGRRKSRQRPNRSRKCLDRKEEEPRVGGGNELFSPLSWTNRRLKTIRGVLNKAVFKIKFLLVIFSFLIESIRCGSLELLWSYDYSPLKTLTQFPNSTCGTRTPPPTPGEGPPWNRVSFLSGK